MRKRQIPIQVYLDESEYNKVKEWSAASKRTMSDYIRELLDDSQPVAFPPIEYQEVLRELRKIGINLNQIARHLNEGGTATKEIVEEVRSAALDLADLKYEILKIVGDAYGNN